MPRREHRLSTHVFGDSPANSFAERANPASVTILLRPPDARAIRIRPVSSLVDKSSEVPPMTRQAALAIGCLVTTLLPGPRAIADEFVVVKTAGELRAFHPDGTEAEQAPLTRAAADRPRGTLLSPDGKREAYVSGQPPQLYVADAEGQNARAISPPDLDVGCFCWSADGKYLVFLGRPAVALDERPPADHFWQLHGIGASGERHRTFPKAAAGADFPTCLADGRIAFLRYYPRMGKLQRADLVASRLLWSEPAAERAPAGGVEGNEPAKPAVPAKPAEPQVIVRDQWFSKFAFSADGKTLVYGTLGEVVFCDVPTGKQHRIVLRDIEPRLARNAPFHLAIDSAATTVACTLTFVGGRPEFGPPLFGDHELFVIPRDGKATWFEPGVEIDGLSWVGEEKKETP